ncbi:NADPH-dependent pterin aldehyde reductase [Daucus carota subsp. sativus]|uniref:NADPH-dependent pterin aldehyde reductase n=1 Tax=Daucus carota subsp. sativus TaxID=79200 RepID=UPI003082D18F
MAEVPESRRVLITGVSRGLGKSLALEFARLGHTIIGCSRSEKNLDDLQTQLSSDDQKLSNHLFINVDVRSDSSVAELARVVLEKKAVPDIIGTVNQKNRIWEVPEEEFDMVIDTNLKGTANMLRHFIPLMVESSVTEIGNRT